MSSSFSFKVRMHKEKLIYKFWASFSDLEIDQIHVSTILEIKSGLKVGDFYKVYGGSDVIAESLIFKTSMARFINKVYETPDQVVTVFIASRSGYRFEYVIKKKSKKCKYEDYRRLSYLLRYVIVCSSARRWERKLAKKVCKYCLKDWKEIERYGEFCF